MKKILITFLFSSLFSCYAFTGKAVKIKGDVLINNIPLTFKTVIKDGDVIVAKGKKSFSQIKMTNGSTFLIRDGKLTIVAKNKNKSGVNLAKGLLHIFFDKTKNSDFKVWTKNGSLGVRGTKFLVMETSDDTYLCVCEGVVNASNQKMSLDVTKGQDIHMTKSNNLKTFEANKRMWSIANKGFDLMGIPLK